MKKMFSPVIATVFLLFITAMAEAACPTSPTVTVPYPTGAADIVIYSSPACVALSGTDLKIQLGNVAGIVLGAATIPAVTVDTAGLHVSANGGPFGAAYVLYITHLPSSKIVAMTANVGQATVAITANTTTP